MSEALISAADANETIPLHALRRQDVEAFLARRRPAAWPGRRGWPWG